MPIHLLFSTLRWAENDQPKYLQLYEHIRQAILSGRLKSGERLPPSRKLARGLEISRTTVMQAYEHLEAEGYLSSHTGSGTFVSEELPDQMPKTAPPVVVAGQERSRPLLSRRADALMAHSKMAYRVGENLKPFRPGVPALWDFPFQSWFRLMGQQSRSLGFDTYGYGDPAGYLPLRRAISDYLRRSRGVHCEAEQVLIVNGIQQALALSFQLLLDQGGRAWVEDPGYNGAKEAMLATGIEPIPVPLDEEGLSVKNGLEKAPDVKMAYVTPSHQYPMGVVMSLARRLELLEWAARNEGWILEDDYDSEYRYNGKPLAALQGIDQSGRVVYLGTFSKVLFPGMRMGYMVVPEKLVDAFIRAKTFADRGNSILEQAALAAFLEDGGLERHLRRMRLLYKERQEALIHWSAKLLGEALRIYPSNTGLHAVGWLEGHRDDQKVAQALGRRGIIASPVSGYTLKHRQPPGLVLGYAPFREEMIREALEKMAEVC